MKRKTLEELKGELETWSKALDDVAMMKRAYPHNEFYKTKYNNIQRRIVQVRDKIKRRTK